MNSDRYERFRIALLRDDGTAILHAERLARDSNGELHLGFNTSMLPDGIYRLRVEGYTRRGELERFAEARLSSRDADAGRSRPCSALAAAC